MPAGAKKGTVVIVDDDTSLCEVLEHVMAMEGFEVRSIVDAAEAESKIKALRPDVVVVDLLMPNVSGLDLIRALAAGGLGHIPVIVITGYYTGDAAYEELIRRESNVKDFIKKPLVYVALLNRIHDVLGLPRPAR